MKLTRALYFALGVWVARHIFRRHRPLTGPELLARLRELEGQ